MGVDIGCGANITVAQPLLDLFQTDPVGVVNTPPETVPLDRTNGALGSLKWCIATAAMVH